jgi:hypothetical protein
MEAIRAVIARSSIGREAVTDAAIWLRISSWVIVQARSRGGVAPVLQIPRTMPAITTSS